jgi:hypothetical protein
MWGLGTWDLELGEEACEKYHKVGGCGKLTWRMAQMRQLRITLQWNDDGQAPETAILAPWDSY